MTTHFLTHSQQDNVGVAVVEDIEAGMEANVWVMDTDATVTVKTLPTGSLRSFH